MITYENSLFFLFDRITYYLKTVGGVQVEVYESKVPLTALRISLESWCDALLGCVECIARQPGKTVGEMESIYNIHLCQKSHCHHKLWLTHELVFSL